MLEVGATPPPDNSWIGRYEIRRERGRGAMGVVYEAHDSMLDRTVALKAIRLPFTATAADLEEFEKRFFAEARVAACLSHPGIVTVHDVARDPETGTLYMALEYLEGRTLAEVIRGGVAMSSLEALRITASIATALHHAHSKGVVHRDIKPSNIMILANGEPKIMDFGIAKAEGALGRLTVAGQVLGTPLYMSPEQVLGHRVDARSDLFSLGAIAYALLTGHHAFAADNIAKIVARVIEDEPLPLSTLAPGLPCDVNDIVQRAMAKVPADRYPDANAIAEDIQDVLAQRPPRHRDLRATPASSAAAPARSVADRGPAAAAVHGTRRRERRVMRLAGHPSTDGNGHALLGASGVAAPLSAPLHDAQPRVRRRPADGLQHTEGARLHLRTTGDLQSPRASLSPRRGGMGLPRRAGAGKRAPSG